jgi:hypothetical protein
MAKTKAYYHLKGVNDFEAGKPCAPASESWQSVAYVTGYKSAQVDKKNREQAEHIYATTDIIKHDVESFVNGYLVAALWSSSDTLPGKDGEEGETVNLDNFDWADGQEAKLMGDCLAFIQANAADLIHYEQVKTHAPGYGAWECAGHDFWLTRNGHGAGFWDRGLGELGQRLTEACKAFSGVDLYLGDDEQVYASGLGG